jgi:hypothetical protein
MYQVLRGEEFPCPGGHGTDPRTSDRFYEERKEDYLAEHPEEIDPRLGNCALCGAETYEGFPESASYPIYADPGPPLPAGYLCEGECRGQVRIGTESEYGEYSMTPLATWPVASGPCSEALGLDDDEECADPLFARWAERRSMLRCLEQLAYQYNVGLR